MGDWLDRFFDWIDRFFDDNEELDDYGYEEHEVDEQASTERQQQGVSPDHDESGGC
jgi:hypothetical protein